MFFRKKKRVEARPATGAGSAASAAPVGERRADDAPSTQFLTGDALHDQRSVESLLDEVARISERVAHVRGSEDLRELLTYIVDSSIQRTRAQRGFLVLEGAPEPTGSTGPRSGGTTSDAPGAPLHEIGVARQQGGKPIAGEVRYSTSAVKRVLESGAPLKDDFDSSAEALKFGESACALELHSLMCVLLDTERGGRRGVLYVDSRTHTFTARDLSYFTALSRQIAIALRTARLHVDTIERAKLEESLETAKIVQSHLIPRVPDDSDGFDLFGWYRAAERTSGDFYDFFTTRSGKLAVVVGDVTGHGPASALITSTAQAFLRGTLQAIDDPCQALTMLNRDLATHTESGLFVTLLLTLLDSSGSVQIFNLGHVPPCVWRAADGSVTEIASHDQALGMELDIEITASSTIELAAGDLLLGFTDGLTEARPEDDHDALFGEEAIREIVRDVAPTAASASEVGEAVVEAVLEHAADSNEDDLTIVVVRREGG